MARERKLEAIQTGPSQRAPGPANSPVRSGSIRGAQVSGPPSAPCFAPVSRALQNAVLKGRNTRSTSRTLKLLKTNARAHARAERPVTSLRTIFPLKSCLKLTGPAANLRRDLTVHSGTAEVPLEVTLTNVPARPIAPLQIPMLLLDNSYRRGV
jgi:hypothetical protein